MRIFVSYARVDRPYCVQIVEVLDFHDVWYDQKLVGGNQWWKEIQRRLEWCEGFIYLFSAESLSSEYCRQEFETAQALGKHVFPVLIDKNVQIPADLSILHYINLSDGLTVEGVRDLLRAIYTAEQQDWQHKAAGSGDTSSTNEPDDTNDSALTSAIRAMELGHYTRAIDLIHALKETKEKPVFIDLDKMLVEAEAALTRDHLRQQMEREYRDIYHLIRAPITRAIGVEAFNKFRKTHPAYDPDKLVEQVDQVAVKPPSLLSRLNQASARVPLLEWCEIPAGKVRLESGGRGESTHVDSFLMARYPITNIQYHLFLKAPKGYSDPSWWDFSPEARAWRESATKPLGSVYKGADRPRENVNWYDARAFCNWLSAVLKADIVLPTLRQRQRAVMGAMIACYPWGDVFDKNRCNTREGDVRMTTVVNRYTNGASPYEVYDLAGNVWEWTTDTAPDEDPRSEHGYKVVVHGGAFLSPYSRAHVAHFLLVPPQTRYGSIGFRAICLYPNDTKPVG